MMLHFQPKHKEMILSGRKTETRRFSNVSGIKVGEMLDATTGREVFTKLLITDVREQKVWEFTNDDARREGYDKVDQLWEALMEHRGLLELQMTMHVVQFAIQEHPF